MFKSYTQLPFVDEKAKVNASYYVTKLLPNLIKDCRHLLSDNFILQQRWCTCSHISSCPRLDQKEMPWFRWKKTNRHQIRQISVHWIIMTADTYHWNVWTVDEKVVQSLIRYFWIFRTRLHVHLKKWTLMFKLLYLLNHTCYFNKICRNVAWILICKRFKFGEKNLLQFQRYRIFPRELLFWRSLYIVFYAQL